MASYTYLETMKLKVLHQVIDSMARVLVCQIVRNYETADVETGLVHSKPQ